MFQNSISRQRLHAWLLVRLKHKGNRSKMTTKKVVRILDYIRLSSLTGRQVGSPPIRNSAYALA